MKSHVTTVVIAAALTLTFAGCSSDSTSTQVNSEPVTTIASVEPVKPIPDLTGDWKQTNSQSPDSYQQATITADVISVDWVSDNGDTTSIYWIGTFTPPADVAEPYVWTSDRDKEATDMAILASTDDTKEFTYEDGVISYSVSALGTTTKVKLERQS